MIIRKYIVDDVKDAMTRAKYELGPEAMILSKHKVKIGKWYNLFKKDKIEVIIGIEESKLQKNDILALEEILENNPIFKDADDELKDRLFGYCKLNQLDWKGFSKKNSIEFIDFLYKDSCFKGQRGLDKINIFVGPTGVGKTTNVAKLAAREKLFNKKNVGILTIDTYKIGGIEQIQSYAKILEIPFAVAENPKDIKEKMELFKGLDLVLIDTVGMSQNSLDDLEKINRYIKNIKLDKRIILCLNMSTEKEIMESMLKNYNILNYDGVLLTKFDELVNFKKFWETLDIIDKPVEYFSFGEKIPEDIDEASLLKVIEYIESNSLKEASLN